MSDKYTCSVSHSLKIKSVPKNGRKAYRRAVEESKFCKGHVNDRMTDSKMETFEHKLQGKEITHLYLMVLAYSPLLTISDS